MRNTFNGSNISSSELSADNLTLRLDVVDTVSYLGEATPGTATSSATWRIKKITEVGSDVTIEYADGNTAFDNVWDNRTGLSYS
jgi:hypothetical protein